MSTLSINGVDLAYDEAGEGPALLLIHAGITDRRMWDEAMPAFAKRYRTIRFDLRGYGESPLPDGPFVYTNDAAALLDALGVERAHVVGVSMGGGVALDLALARPELVDRLVLVAPGINGWDFKPEMDAFDEAETAALKAGDLDEASWINVRFWLDGPTRGPTEVEPELRRRVFGMQRLAFTYENPKAEGSWVERDRRARLGEVRAPTLVVVGELDQPDMVEIAQVLADEIPRARRKLIPGVAHLPPMEAPDAFADLTLDFLGQPPGR